MVTLQNTQQHPIHIGTGVDGYTVPAMGKVTVEKAPKETAGIAVLSKPAKKAAPVAAKPAK